MEETILEIPQVVETHLPDGSSIEGILRGRPRLGRCLKNDGNRYEAATRKATVHDHRFVFRKGILGHDSFRNASTLQGIPNRPHGQGLADAKLTRQTAAHQLGTHLWKYWGAKRKAD